MAMVADMTPRGWLMVGVAIISQLVVLSAGKTVDVVLSDYHNYTQLMDELDTLIESYSELSRLYILGGTIEERDIPVIQISQGVREDRVKLKPMIKLIANMHGNEAVGRELMLALARYLLQNYERDPRVAKIVNETDIHIVPTLNPDGFENSTKGICLGHHRGSGRHNGNLVDLNRAFPSWDDLAETKEQLMAKSEPEVAAVIDWIFSQPFVLSANFHDGAVVANYPWDDSHGPERERSISPDDTTFVDLATLYATNHANMFQGVGLCHEDNFPGGITNGAEWYIVKGGMQDFNYLFSNCMELTIEVSCCKYPMESELQKHWNQNKESLLSYLEVVQGGVRGYVRDENGDPVPNAVIEVNGIQKNITTSYFGEYWRLLSAGKYCIRATSPDGSLLTEWVQITVTPMDSKKHVRVDFTLSSLGAENSVNTCDLELRVPVAPAAAPVKPSSSPLAPGSGAQKNQVLEQLAIFLVFHVILLTNFSF
eukprot:TRINITY_DN52848_c0_g1_i1.p1 TRINITY_DN52848_c0_g1~~TRINITY_DN52848_c0_g1_i1.p1  ORF type:complete len:483 (-),score=100.01 TRINITY_DN52848_c0_g1_i1:48-1496(-)